MIADEEQLEEEREFSRKNRDKFAAYGNTGTMATNSGGIGGGSKYQGFGSEDLKKYSGGYDVHGTNKPSAGYDPYKRKGGSAFDTTAKSKHTIEKKKDKKKDTPKKKAKKSKAKKKSESEDSDDSSDDDDSGSDDSSEEEKPKPKKDAKKGLSNPGKKPAANNKTSKPKAERA